MRSRRLRGTEQLGALAAALLIVATGCSSTARKTAAEDGPAAAANSETGAADEAKGSTLFATGPRTSGSGAGSGGRAGSSSAATTGGGSAATGTQRAGAVGRGVTAKTIKITFFGADPQYASAVYQGLGAGGLDPGPQLDAAKAMVAYMNKHGGIAGRKIQPYYYEVAGAGYDEQEACATIAEDNDPFAVITNNAVDQMPACLKKHGTILLQDDTAVHDANDFRSYAPFYYAPSWFDQTRNATVYVDGLAAQGFFKGAKLGLILYDAPFYHRAADVLEKRLARYGMKLTERFAYPGITNPDAAGNAVVRFRSSGVTHVMVLDFHTQMVVTFANAAESQGYRPRYGLNSFSQWSVLRDEGSLWRPEQYRGAIGVGHRPIDDVNDRQHNSAIKQCVKIYSDAGLELNGANAARYAVAYCDLLNFLKLGLERAPALSAQGLWQAVGRFGEGFTSALAFRTRFGPNTGLGGPITIRYGAFNQACQCFKYTSGPKLIKE